MTSWGSESSVMPEGWVGGEASHSRSPQQVPSNDTRYHGRKSSSAARWAEVCSCSSRCSSTVAEK